MTVLAVCSVVSVGALAFSLWFLRRQWRLWRQLQDANSLYRPIPSAEAIQRFRDEYHRGSNEPRTIYKRERSDATSR